MKIVLTTISLLITFIINGQEHTLSGTIKDTLNRPLVNANLIATPISEDVRIAFAITNQDGFYNVRLEENVTYKMEISYLGFEKIKETIALTADQTKNIIMTASQQSLGEVVIIEKLPVKVRKDTITYRPDKFMTGEERKLVDVLKKLPGIDVDREGNVKVNGEEVTRLMVDGKQFFTGDEKLGVKNIPADAVAEIEAIDNYNEVSFLKDLNDSEELALNIKLKEGKKNFVFGEVAAGGGIEDRYVGQTSSFYYSPKTAVNAIVDFNNIGEKAFTPDDYVSFEGGFNSFASSPDAYLKLYFDDFAQYLRETDFRFARNNFGAISINQRLSERVNIDGYVIYFNNKVKTRREQEINYLTDSTLDENRTRAATTNANFLLSKLRLRYKNEKNLDVRYDIFFKTNNSERQESIRSATVQETNFVNQNSRPTSYDLTQKLSIDKKLNDSHTSSALITHNYALGEEQQRWNFSEASFAGLIPFQENQATFELLQNTNNVLNTFSVNFKHYWTLNGSSQLHPEMGARLVNQRYRTLDFLDEDEPNALDSNDFNNNLDFNLTESYVGMTYKLEKGKFKVKPALFYRYYDWKISQYDLLLRKTGKTVLLPQLEVEYEFARSNTLTFEYELVSQFTEGTQFANRLRLSDFNQVFRGNERLENQLYQRCFLKYRNFNLFTGNILNARIIYTNQLKSTRNTTVLQDIDQVNTLIYTSLPENRINGSVSFTKLLGKYKLEFGNRVNYATYPRIVNDQVFDFTNKSYTYSLSAKTNFNKGPNATLRWNQSFSTFSSQTDETQFIQTIPSLRLEWRFYEDFFITTDYTYSQYQNKSTDVTNTFGIGNAGLVYNKEGNPWTFSVDVTNFFDVDFRNTNDLNNFFVSDTRKFIQPRIVLGKIAYAF